jgi:hypothetical protein
LWFVGWLLLVRVGGRGALLIVFHRVTAKLMFPFREDLVRFDFEVGAEDEWMCEFGAVGEGRV